MIVWCQGALVFIPFIRTVRLRVIHTTVLAVNIFSCAVLFVHACDQIVFPNLPSSHGNSSDGSNQTNHPEKRTRQTVCNIDTPLVSRGSWEVVVSITFSTFQTQLAHRICALQRCFTAHSQPLMTSSCGDSWHCCWSLLREGNRDVPSSRW